MTKIRSVLVLSLLSVAAVACSASEPTSSTNLEVSNADAATIDASLEAAVSRASVDGGVAANVVGDATSPSAPTCGALATQSGYKNPLCEHDGNGACNGAGPATSDCAHCCDGPPKCCMALPNVPTSRGFDGCTGGNTHYGIDYPFAVGTPLTAGMSGTIIGAQTSFPDNCWGSGSCGGLACSCACLNTDFNFLKLRADCGDPADPSRDFYVYYSHISALAPGIAVGAHVQAGDLIAYSGNSGCSSGPHLHLETVSVAQGSPAFLATCDSVDGMSRACQ